MARARQTRRLDNDEGEVSMRINSVTVDDSIHILEICLPGRGQ